MGITIVGLPRVQKAVEELDGKDRSNAMRRGVRAAAKPFQAALKSVASSSDVPRSFQKVPAAKVTTRGGASGREISAHVRPKSPLFNIFEPGAGQHEIAPRRVGVLAGPEGGGSWDTRGRKRGQAFFSRGPVRHPGMKSRPILPRAFRQGQAQAIDAFAAAIFAPGKP